MAAIKRRKARGPVSIVVLVLSLVGITWVVHLSGTNSIAVHFYYLPILWAGFAFGDYGAIVVSLLAALACGPWMPAAPGAGPDVPPVAQSIWDVVVRMGIFYVVGIFASRLSFELRRRVVEAETMYEVARSITSTLRIREVLELITEHAVEVMEAKACNIRLLDQEGRELKLVASTGLNQDYWDKGPVLLASNITDQKVLSGEPQQIYDVLTDPRFQYKEAAREARLTSVLIVPLQTKDKSLGVIRVYSRAPHRFAIREIELLTAFADQASVALENAELYEDIRRNYYETVRTLTRAIEAKDSATYSHSERVTDLVDQLAHEVGFPEEYRELLRFGSILHDVGKIGLDEADIRVNGGGNSAEQAFYRMHPLIGQSILAPVTFLQSVLSVVTHHHERWDGTGFPEGLQGDAISYEARMVAIADGYDRLIHPHNPGFEVGLSPREALDEVVAAAGSRFDPELVAVFRRMVMHSRRHDNPSGDPPGGTTEAGQDDKGPAGPTA